MPADGAPRYRTRRMNRARLHPQAPLAIALNALFHVADALCSVFVGAFLYRLSHDFELIMWHYLILYGSAPFVFIAAGWYSQRFDRTHVFRAGLLLHAVYYACFLVLQDRAPDYAIPLGLLLGIAAGIFWAGNNTFSFDVASHGDRDYYFGWLTATTNAARLAAPLLAPVIIGLAPGKLLGYLLLFGLALVVYLAAFALSFRVHADSESRPFHIRRALFPGPDQRDWRLIMLASITLAGSFSIFPFLLGLIMFMSTDSETLTGGYGAFQALVSIVVSYLAGSYIVPRTRKRSMRIAVLALLAAGSLILWRFDLWILVLFGALRSAAMPLFTIPHQSIRYEIIAKSVQYPWQRIEYLCAWEAPLALGRVIMLGALIALSSYLDAYGLRIALFLLCAMRVFTYLLVVRTSVVREAQ
ncbi:MAG: MFS transporter [Candidatus Hydrogenedens sp.]|nr:MFS transporter [Candidatus Hydrogenedens sp.]